MPHIGTYGVTGVKSGFPTGFSPNSFVLSSRFNFIDTVCAFLAFRFFTFFVGDLCSHTGGKSSRPHVMTVAPHTAGASGVLGVMPSSSVGLASGAGGGA